MVRSARCHTALTAPCNFSDLLACVGVLFFNCAHRSFAFWAAYPCSLHRFKQLFIQFTHTLGQAWCERQDGWGKRSWENCFLDLGSGVNVEFAKRDGLLSMRSCATGCCGKMIALASCHRLTRVCEQQAKHERLHQGIHTMFWICIFLLASRVGGHCLQKDDILFSPSAYNAGQFCLQCQPHV